MDAQTDTRDDGTWQLGVRGEDGAAGTILLVEDESFVREVTSEVLRSGGYRVLATKNAIEAEREYLQHCGDVDVVLTDVILPGENGCSLAGRLRMSNPTLKILLVTGYAEQIRALETGREDCLAKPFSTRELLARVKQAMQGRECPLTEPAEPELRPAGGNVQPA